MAKLFVRLPNYNFLFVSFLLQLLLLFYSGTQMVEARLCERRSQTSIGFCVSNLLCDTQCRNMEGALNGACLRQTLGLACFCYVRC
ncbi:hypothetical protein V6N13_143152 [Hibiscus sabdariffa]|uniref:Knottins-like domain-containing protein n=1 Tax=Hibiscus sabdariffa TaxID=183260 RepID=A0ABR2FGW7_9ROSI